LNSLIESLQQVERSKGSGSAAWVGAHPPWSEVWGL